METENTPTSLWAGTPLQEAKAAVILLHGRGGTAADILGLSDFLPREQVHYLAPQAPGNTWYPYSFLAPIARNQPALDHALATVARTVERLLSEGLESQHIVLAGFSQGACLAQEFALRHPKRYGGIVGLSGGLIGPPGIHWKTDGDFDGTPVFLGCSDVDPHIPVERVEESAAVFQSMGAQVDKRIYPSMAHTVNDDEMEAFAAIVQAAASPERLPAAG